MNVVALGQEACRISEQFQSYPQYTVYKMSSSIRNNHKDGRFRLPRFETPEEYEEKCPATQKFLQSVKGDVLFILRGGEIETAASLRIMEGLSKQSNITILYLQPDSGMLGQEERLIDRAVFNVLQQYARSALVKGIHIVSQEALQDAIGDVPVVQYEQKQRETLATTLHMINVLQKTTPVYSSLSDPSPVARICSYGVCDFETGDETMFYPLELVRERQIMYLIPSKILNEDSKLMKKIKKQVNEKSNDGKIKINFAVYESEYDKSIVYLVDRTSAIQGDTMKFLKTQRERDEET